MTRINYFNINRDLNKEEIIYKNFCDINGCKYILYHNSNNLITKEINNIIKNNNDLKFINLDNISSIFFDYIKVIQNSKEIYLIDSVWSVMIYLLSCKYFLFNNIKITVYCKRNHYNFYEQIKLDNWILI